MADAIQDVNIELGDDISRMLYEASVLTQENRPGLVVEAHKTFSGLRGIPLGSLVDVENLWINMAFDGVGTKVEVNERLKHHAGTAFDLFAMVLDDVVIRGAEPLAIGSILDVRQLDDTSYTRRAITELAMGYVAAAKAGGVVVVNGEVAELGDRVGGYVDQSSFLRRILAHITRNQAVLNPDRFNYNWGATALWAAHKDRILTGHKIQPGDAVIGIVEPGFRSNGLTDVRKGLRKEYGKKWHEQVEPSLGEQTLGELVQTPSTIYAKFITSLTGGYDITREPKAEIHGAAHITGGGQPSKIGRMLEPTGLGVVIDNPLRPPEVMQHVQKVRGLSDREAYGKFHMGPGMVAVTPETDVEKVLESGRSQGFELDKIGYVTARHNSIKIKNYGVQQKEEWLEFAPKNR